MREGERHWIRSDLLLPDWYSLFLRSLECLFAQFECMARLGRYLVHCCLDLFLFYSFAFILFNLKQGRVIRNQEKVLALSSPLTPG